jgi:O-antigen ligase
MLLGQAFARVTDGEYSMSGRGQIDKLFSVVLVLNATGVFRFLAPPLDILTPRFSVTIGVVTIGLFVLNISYLVVRAEYIAALFRRGLLSVLLILVVWPILTILYSPSFALREFGLILYLFSLLSASAVYTLANGLRAFHRLLAISLIVTAVGLVLSMIVPQYFESVAELKDGRVKYSGRSFGFFMQPNKLACGLGFLFLGWFSLCSFKNTMREAVAILVFLAMMLLTGSRSGALLAGILVAFITVHSWLRCHVDGGHVLKVVALALCLVAAQVGMRYYVVNHGDSLGRTDVDLIARMSSLLKLKLSNAGSVVNDRSVQERVEAQLMYLELIAERPVLGHGFGSNVYYLANGPLFLSAHSDLVTCVMEYGLLYPVALYWLVLQLYQSPNRRAVESAFGTNSILQFVSAAVFIMTINGDLLQTRVLYVAWGMYFAAVNCPEYLFSRREISEKANCCVGTGAIRHAHSKALLPNRKVVQRQTLSRTPETLDAGT